MTKRAAIYVRISKDREGAGLGVARQEGDCRDLAASLGVDVVRVYSDNDLSAYSGKARPDYLSLLADVKAGIVDVVLTWHGDRLHRSPVELEAYIAACEPRGVPTHTVKAGLLDLATPSGRMVARQLGAVARYEVEHMIERQRSAKAQAAADGRFRGGRRPFGYEADGMTVVPAEAAEVLRASRAVLAGTSLRSIARDLNARSVFTSTGAPWRPDTVRKVLVRPRNAGLVDNRGQIVASEAWPAVVPEDLWRGTVAVLENPDRLSHLSNARRWLGGGLFRCGVCASRDVVTTVRATSSSRSGQRTSYVCDGPTKHLGRVADEVDRFVRTVIVARLSLPDAADTLIRPTVDTSPLKARQATIHAKLNESATMWGRDEITAAQLKTITEEKKAELEAIGRQLAAATPRTALSGIAGAADAGERWDACDLDRRRAIVAELATVTLLPGHRGRPAGWVPGASYFDPTTVRIEPKR